MSDVLDIKVVLEGSNPSIWRRLLVDETTSFMDLHHILQIAMGWKNYHLFEFNLDGFRVGKVYEPEEEGTSGMLNASETKLCDVLSFDGDAFTYEYDFGDGWSHQITVEQKLPREKGLSYPTCIAGERSCPPEDCGGMGGFHHLLTVISDKKHPDYKEMKLWLGRGFNANTFDGVKVNRQLGELAKYIKKWNSPR